MRWKTERSQAVMLWAVVATVGIVVLILVAGLHLHSRLDAGQAVLDDARPAFTDDRAAGDRAGINMVSTIVDLADPIVTAKGGATDDAQRLIIYVSNKTGLPPAQVLSLLSSKFPHTTALLKTLPLEKVTAELPGLVNFLSTTLKLPPDQVLAALQANFPHLAQSIAALPTVTNGWDNVPGTDDLTRFSGAPVHTVRDVRAYFSGDVVPVVETQNANFQRLDSSLPKVGWITPILVAVGAVVIVYAVLMMMLFWHAPVRGARATATWGVVVLVGVLLLVIALPLGLFPRLYRGQDLLDAASPAFTSQRVAGDRAGISMVSSIVDLSDPIVTAQGGGAAEVPKLLAFVSSKTGLSQEQVLAALQTNFPHTTALLQAIPLEAVTAELPGLEAFLATTLHITGAQLNQAVAAVFPHLGQSIAALPTVTAGWESVQGTENLTRFDGSPARSVPQIRTYFAADVIPVLERQQGNFRELATTSPQLIVFPLLLTIVGAAVVIYGVLMMLIWRRLDGDGPLAGGGSARTVPKPTPA